MLLQYCPSGSWVLEVQDHSQFCVGQEIIIGYGTERVERACIASFGSLNLTAPTMRDHYPHEQIIDAAIFDRQNTPQSASSPPSALTNTGTTRGASPVGGPDVALGSAFNTQGQSNGGA